MALDRAPLKKVVLLEGGDFRAQCPACALASGDRNGTHLRVWADGRYGCCVAPKDKGYRQEIFKLAGARRVKMWRVGCKRGGGA